MKTKLIISVLILFSTLTLHAQDEIVSIWLNDTVKLYTQPFNHVNEIYWGPPIDITYGGGAENHKNGLYNTNDIVAQLGDNGGVPYAALVCDTLTVGGFTDWYLPCSIELMEMFAKSDSLGSMSSFYSENTSFVWSSTECGDTCAHCYVFGSWMWGENKNVLANVRCIRREYSVGIDKILTNSIQLKFLNESNDLYVIGNVDVETKLTIYSVKGNQMLTHIFPASSIIIEKRFSLMDLIPGIYIVRLQSETTNYSKSIIIN